MHDDSGLITILSVRSSK